jgi:hypothetical protein
MKNIFNVVILFLIIGCKTETDPIKLALQSTKPEIKKVVDSLDKYEVQILFTEVHRGANHKVTFTDYRFSVDDSTYFYPASTVKFPIAILALEKLAKEKRFNRNSNFFIEGDSVTTTFSNEIEKIFTVSDNAAYNRLFEYLGQDDINSKLASKGINPRISHRLSVDDSENITTKSLVVYVNDSTTITTEEIINQPIKKLHLKKLLKGRGYVEDDSLILKQKDFSTRNYLPLNSLHSIMKQLIFPELYPKEQQFHLSEGDRKFLLETMKIGPGRQGYPLETPEGSNKLLIFGDSNRPMQNHIDIYNKTGGAYGYLTDCAYIVDKKKNKEWIITATIYVNDNQIFNDDVYEYDSIGIPFLAELGRQLIKF